MEEFAHFISSKQELSSSPAMWLAEMCSKKSRCWTLFFFGRNDRCYSTRTEEMPFPSRCRDAKTKLVFDTLSEGKTALLSSRLHITHVLQWKGVFVKHDVFWLELKNFKFVDLGMLLICPLHDLFYWKQCNMLNSTNVPNASLFEYILKCKISCSNHIASHQQFH